MHDDLHGTEAGSQIPAVPGHHYACVDFVNDPIRAAISHTKATGHWCDGTPSGDGHSHPPAGFSTVAFDVCFCHYGATWARQWNW
jgi:hypothetical protein